MAPATEEFHQVLRGSHHVSHVSFRKKSREYVVFTVWVLEVSKATQLLNSIVAVHRPHPVVLCSPNLSRLARQFSVFPAHDALDCVHLIQIAPLFG